MNLDSLLPHLGEWLQGTGPDADVVISTRVRLARNLAGYPFITKASPAQKAAIEAKARDALRDAGELTALRKKLTRAVKDEDYEAAARLRDRIRELEGV